MQVLMIEEFHFKIYLALMLSLCGNLLFAIGIKSLEIP
jgi:hypothetical protein